ncbi:MAG TPA: DUF2169 domain-containing protein [Rhizobacter sp.]|nr:DUF2169 domain-containing protein [Rhizobacter sp.]
MPHPALVNLTPFSVTPLFLTDNDLRPVFVPLVRATFAIQADGELLLHDPQMPPQLAGVFWGDPIASSYKFEPECAFFKPATDVALIGHACAPRPGTTELQVGLRIGPLQKVVRVTGDRVMSRSMGSWSISPARPFEQIPLIYEKAFGGWDRHDADPLQHRFEPRNPVGTGFRRSSGSSSDDLVMPNIEDPSQLFTQIGDTPVPAGFGFTSPSWQPRAAYAGTYDAAWDSSRRPLLPKDFDSRFFNAASPGLLAPGFLAGDEAVMVGNASVRGKLTFKLPGVAAPVCEFELRKRQHHTLQTQLDTVIIDTDAHLLHLLWRGHQRVPGGPHDLVALRVSSATHALPPTLEAV